MNFIQALLSPFLNSLKWDPNNLTCIYIWFIDVVAVALISHLLLRFFQSRKRTKSILNKLALFSRDSIDVQTRQELNEFFDTQPISKSIWHEFDESLVIIPGNEKVHNTIDASFFFNAETLGTRFINSRLIASVPGLLSALGVLGTFYGLSKGLAGIKLSGDDISTMKTGITVLLSGAGTAFMTSLWGVGLSFIYNFLEKFLERALQNKIKILQDQIDVVFPRLTAEHQLQQIVDHSLESRTALQGLAEQIGGHMQEAMATAADSMGNAVATTLERTLGGALDRLNGGNEESMGSLIDEFMKKFESIASAPSEGFKHAAEENKNTFDAFTQNMTSFIANFDERMATQESRDISRNNTLKKVVQDIAEQSQTASNKLRDAVDELISKLGAQVSNAISEISIEDKKRSDNSLNEAQILEQLVTGQTAKIELLLKQGETLNNSVGKIGTANLNAAEELKIAALEINQTSHNFNKAGSTIISGASNLGNKLQLASQTVEAMGSANNENIKNIEKIQNQFEMHYKALNDIVLVIDKLSTAAENTFDGLTQKQTDFLTGLQNEVNTLTSKISSFLTEYTNEVQNQTNSRMNEWNDHTRQYTSQMKDVIDSISGIVDEIDGKLSGARA